MPEIGFDAPEGREKEIAEKIAGEVVLSDEPGRTLRKWRENFGVSQSRLSDELGVSSSVVSDYESGRRESPGIQVVKRIIEALLQIDREQGGSTLRRYERVLGAGFGGDAVKDIKDYDAPITVQDFYDAIDADVLVDAPIDEIKGHTVINSIEAITTFTSDEFSRLYGWSTQRALVFTGVTRGESPLVAIRVTNLKPSLVALHGIREEDVSEVAPRLAEIEGVGLCLTDRDLETMISELNQGG